MKLTLIEILTILLIPIAMFSVRACVEGILNHDYRRAVIYFGFCIGSAAVAWG